VSTPLAAATSRSVAAPSFPRLLSGALEVRRGLRSVPAQRPVGRSLSASGQDDPARRARRQRSAWPRRSLVPGRDQVAGRERWAGAPPGGGGQRARRGAGQSQGCLSLDQASPSGARRRVARGGGTGCESHRGLCAGNGSSPSSMPPSTSADALVWTRWPLKRSSHRMPISPGRSPPSCGPSMMVRRSPLLSVCSPSVIGAYAAGPPGTERRDARPCGDDQPIRRPMVSLCRERPSRRAPCWSRSPVGGRSR
jgi:hypothetical protein